MAEGIKRYGEKAVEAVLTEYAQLNEKGVFEPIFVDKLTTKQRKIVLNLITMVKRKRCGKVKGRACADDRKQRKYISKEDSTSPTVHLESLILSIIVDTYERRDIATADIDGAFLLADINDFVCES